MPRDNSIHQKLISTISIIQSQYEGADPAYFNNFNRIIPIFLGKIPIISIIQIQYEGLDPYYLDNSNH